MRSLLKRRSLELKPLNVRGLLTETVALAQTDARHRRVSLNLELLTKLPGVRGDRVHLQQVLLNLMLNGMDALANIPATERRVTVRAVTDPKGGVIVSVSDTGPGIPDDKLDRIFEPFFTTKPDGMGMGLSISRTIIEAHGGKIWAENNSLRGAVFKFLLPVAPQNL
jgi:two-component system, LuxR family, sensor kinase FixL